MKTSRKCIECFFKQAQAAAALIKLNRVKRDELFSRLTKKLLKFDFNHPPVVFGRQIYKTIARVSGIKDVFFKEKIRIENSLVKFRPLLQDFIASAPDPLHAAAKTSCAANAIDFGAGKAPDLGRLFTEIKKAKLRVDDFGVFKNKLVNAKQLLVIGDNCGEAFFDRFFIQEILKCNPKIKVFYAARSAPIINDVLVSDARRVGLDKVAHVFSSGCDYPGLIFSKTSAYFKNVYRRADLVISKGQGNFESFSGTKDIFYLFKTKCPPVAQFLSLPLNSLLFLHNQRIKGQ